MQKFMIDFEEVTEEEFYEQLEASNRYECEDTYDDMLDNSEEEVEVLGFAYSPSVALKRIDECRYNIGLYEYSSYEFEEARCELERFGSVTVHGTRFDIEEEDEEEEDED